MKTRPVRNVKPYPAVWALCACSALVTVPVIAQNADNQITDEEGRQIVVEEKAPQVSVDQPAPEITAEAGSTDVQVQTDDPEVSVETSEPEVSVEQPEPEVRIEQADPEVVIRDAEPQVEVNQAEPEVEIIESEPEIEIVERGEQQQEEAAAQQDQQIQTEPQTQEQQITQQPQARQPQDPQVTPADLRMLRGLPVQTAQGEELGEIDDIVMDDAGNTGFVVSVGGFLGIGDTEILVPADEVEVRGDTIVWQTAMSRDQIEEQAQYDEQDYVSMIN